MIRTVNLVSWTVALAAVCSASVPVFAEGWIRPLWPSGWETGKEAVPLYWFVVSDSPLVYRTDVEVPGGVDAVVAAVRTTGYVYIYVDGRLVFGWAPGPEGDLKEPAVQADPDRVHYIDLSEELSEGRHTLAVSAPATGFLFDGGCFADGERGKDLVAPGSWTCRRFEPTTVLEDEAFLETGYSGVSSPVTSGGNWRVDSNVLCRMALTGALERAEKKLSDASWRLSLLVRKGIYVQSEAAFGWGGPNRIPRSFRNRAGRLLKTLRRLQRRWRSLRILGKNPETILTIDSEIRGLEREAEEILQAGASLSQEVAQRDQALALSLAETVISETAPTSNPDSVVVSGWRRLERRWAHPLNQLNESRYDRLGWINHPDLTDGNLARWGLRVNPSSSATRFTLPYRWRFSIDSRNQGIAEKRYSTDYNKDTQWRWIDGRRSWSRLQEFRNYEGIAWYRQWVRVPLDWIGQEVFLTLVSAGQTRVWWNGKEVTECREEGRRTTCTLDPGTLDYGARNCVAIRIQAEGARRGLIGAALLSCPGAGSSDEVVLPKTDILATPLSPCVVLEPRDKTLHLHHPGKAKLFLPGTVSPVEVYQASGDGPLAENHILLWLTPARPSDPIRPVLLVFRNPPLSITTRRGITRVRFSESGQRVVVVRPWVKTIPREPDVATMRFWARAALAVPINYVSLTRVQRRGESTSRISVGRLPRGPVIENTVVYDYLVTEDAWGTRPLKLAPLPALCSYALEVDFRGLTLQKNGRRLEIWQDGGDLAAYRGFRETDRVGYSYPVEPFPRQMGFTSWMFTAADTGVPGNRREVELIAATGANSYRTQHNWSSERPAREKGQGSSTKALPATGGRTRVQIMADYCNAAGLNYVNNVDQTIGLKLDEFRLDYQDFVETRLQPHYDKLVPQLASRPFWAVSYDLINEPVDHPVREYDLAMKHLTQRIRRLDQAHLLYIEPGESYAAIEQLDSIEPTGDPLTGYSFHDYRFRIRSPRERWPTLKEDIRDIYRAWLPAFRYAIEHQVLLHCGEFGGFSASSGDNHAQELLLNDFFRIFDQFGMHSHYHSGRNIYRLLDDGSLRASRVVLAYRAYFRRPGFNLYYPDSRGHRIQTASRGPQRLDK